MKERKIYKTIIGGREVEIETGAYCGQTNGTCLVKCGETVVMVNVTMSKSPRDGIDFFPLGVDFEEKMYSVGKIPGGFKKREARPSDKGILVCRLIDRPLRPLFPKGMFNDVSVVATCLSIEPNFPPEVYAMIGSSVALSISDIPFAGPTGSVVVGFVDGEYIINPTSEQRDRSTLHLNVSGTKDAILMVEAGGNELTEDEMIAGILFAHEEIKKIVAFIETIQAEIGKPKLSPVVHTVNADINEAVRAYTDAKMDITLNEFDRQARMELESGLDSDVFAHFAEIFPAGKKDIAEVLYKMKKEKIRAKILETGIRPDGRQITDIRHIWCEHGILPRVHGSGVFTRGQTQVLNITTLGTISEVQKLEGIDEEVRKRYMHHYNFPGYSVGEAKPMRSPGRREIGHGALAERALEPVLPNEIAFPYAIRTVSEVMSSNGSTSMASVCGSSLSLMDAGVPIKAPVAGVAMGLISNEDKSNVKVLTDIQGLEDFLGDMDFKVAGTKDGITAIQMDIKIKGINEQILRQALEQARVGRLEILDKMNEVISKPNDRLSTYAPKIISFDIDPDKIREVIGSGGKVINKIIEDTGVKIDINEAGTVFIASVDYEKAELAKAIVMSIVKVPELNEIIDGKVVRLMDFGVFVNISHGKDGMVHISKLSTDRVECVTDVVNMEDKVRVQVIKVDEKGRVDLKLVEVLERSGIKSEPPVKSEPKFGGGGNRGNRR